MTAGALAAIGAGLARSARADTWPGRPIRFVVPFPPGGGTDILARQAAQRLYESLKVAVVVENKPGAATNLAAAEVARSAGDGHTVLVGTISIAANPALYRTLQWRPSDLTPVAMLANSPSILAVPANSPFRSAAELVAFSRANRGRLNYASWGVGSGAHLATELFRQTTGLDAVHVPYSGGGPALNSLATGDSDLVFSSVLPVLPLARAGKARLLAIASEQRLPSVPEVPTFREQGIDFVTGTWFGFFVSSRTPEAIVDALARAIEEVMARKDLQDAIARDGGFAGSGDRKAFEAFVAAETRRWAALVRSANISLD